MREITKLVLREGAGWDAYSGASIEHAPFDQALFAEAPPTLCQGATKPYRKLASAPEYLAWWAAASGGSAPGPRRFAIETSADHWERPWEAMIAALQPRRWPDVAMLRLVAEQSAAPVPRDVGAPLRVLILQGREGGDDLQDLDLAAELAALTQARSNLDAAAQKLVCPLDARPVGFADLVPALVEVKPTILWLSGHATEDPAGFLLADGSWLRPDMLAAAICEAADISGAVPLYVVLWACKTGLKERFAAPRAAPPFIAALAGAGVSAVLATLGPLADDIAPEFAATIFDAVAAGRPLDHAVARARAVLMAKQLTEDEREDWACPVVWCVDPPVEDVVWSDTAMPTQRQSLARRLLAADLEPADLDSHGEAQKGLWLHHRRIWVVDRLAGAFQMRSEWLGRTVGQQTISTQMVIVLDFRDGTARNVMRDWARRLLQVADGFDDPDRRLRILATTMADDQERGWRTLCEHENITLGLLSPPEEEDWLWDALRGQGAAAIVLAESFPGDAATDEWRVEQLSVTAPSVGFDPLQHPLAPALALLAFPAAELDLSSIDSAEVQALKQAGYLIQTRAGCVMPLSRAATFVDQLEPDQLVAAHRDAFTLLDGAVARARIEEGADEALLKARLYHAKLGREPAALAKSAQQLMDRYRNERRAGPLLDVFDQVDHREIDEMWKVTAGWAYLQIGAPAFAKDWLDLAEDDELDVVTLSTKLELLAEFEKSSGNAGSKTRAREQLKAALAVLTDELDNVIEPIRLRIQHDLARLTHFLDGDATTAIEQYEAIYAQWQALPHSRLDQAITLRNLAEARMMLADQGGSDLDVLLSAASENLTAARDALPPHTGHTVAAEIEYVTGRLAVRLHDEDAATSYFEKACSVGLATNHLMMVAIAEARLFWRRIANQSVDQYDPGQWTERANALTPFISHAWTARVLIDGHLRSARKLFAAGLQRPALRGLIAAQSLLEANPVFDAGSDRDRIMATCAGLVIARKDPGLWHDLPARFAWAEQWMAERGSSTPEKVWESLA